jgi:pimeloyl-[acyl-carrier protein] synthase
MATAPVVDVNFAEAQQLGNDLIDRLTVMREADPIYFSEVNGGIWIVNGHKEVAEAFAGKKPLSSVRLPGMVMMHLDQETQATAFPNMVEVTKNWVINMDRPASWRLRNLAQRAFSSQVAESLRPTVKTFIEDAFAAVENENRIEFVDAVARRIPARTILTLFGLGDDVYPKLHDWSVSLNAALSGINAPLEVLEAAERSMIEMKAMLLPEIEKRRAQPTDDFISLLITARDGDDKLSEAELVAMLIIVLIAGHDTTANTIALGTAALAGLPEQRAFIRENPDKIGAAVMEIMRYIAMSTAMARIATEDFGWNGHHIAAGSVVFLMIAGANRDPNAFPDPDRFDPTRGQNGNMTFAPGLHFCIGHFLAKVQLQEFFKILVDRYDPEVLDDRLNFGFSIGFRGLDTLHLRLDRR